MALTPEPCQAQRCEAGHQVDELGVGRPGGLEAWRPCTMRPPCHISIVNADGSELLVRKVWSGGVKEAPHERE